jgi:hypothetical protein
MRSIFSATREVPSTSITFQYFCGIRSSALAVRTSPLFNSTLPVIDRAWLTAVLADQQLANLAVGRLSG